MKPLTYKAKLVRGNEYLDFLPKKEFSFILEAQDKNQIKNVLCLAGEHWQALNLKEIVVNFGKLPELVSFEDKPQLNDNYAAFYLVIVRRMVWVDTLYSKQFRVDIVCEVYDDDEYGQQTVRYRTDIHRVLG